MNNRCPYHTCGCHCEFEIEHDIAQAALQEAEECFALLRRDYQHLRKHTDKLEAILKEHNIDYPEGFYGWQSKVLLRILALKPERHALFFR